MGVIYNAKLYDTHKIFSQLFKKYSSAILLAVRALTRWIFYKLQIVFINVLMFRPCLIHAIQWGMRHTYYNTGNVSNG